ncbi:MAG TPA: M23 family metallopeptidase [Candidatus Angelobacter sp.]|nr:M23 family metallopeptidase [Candidatus Angelobacter sp.]
MKYGFGRILILVFGLAGVLSSAQEFPSEAALQQGKKFVDAFYTGNVTEIWKNMNAQGQRLVENEAGLAALADQVKAKYGTETSIVSERVLPGPHLRVYSRLAKYTISPRRIVVVCSFDDAGKISGFYVREEQKEAESKYLDYLDKAKFVLPIKGPWLVYTGGRSGYDNYYAVQKNQRFAYDFTIVRDQKLYANQGDKLQDYFSFGQPVLAPADGVVAAVEDQYDDNPPLKPSVENPKQGNNVVIDHGHGEFSMLAYLKRGSIKVKAGEKVKAGQEIGLCGNSGNSPFPHVHYHLQNIADWSKGEGLPVQFRNYLADGKEVSSGEPIRFQLVQAK